MLRGALDPVFGWVMDFNLIDTVWQGIHAQLDHRYLNDIAGLENPTSERLAEWLWNALHGDLPQLSSVAVMEGRDMGCLYHGPDARPSDNAYTT